MQRFTSGRTRRPIRAQAAMSQPDRQVLLLILTGLIVAAIGFGPWRSRHGYGAGKYSLSESRGAGGAMSTLDTEPGHNKQRSLLGWTGLFFLLVLAGAVFGYVFGSVVS